MARPRPSPPTGGPLQRQARALGDPTRHAIFEWMRERAGAIAVADLEARFGLTHTTIRQHLARLVAADLVVEDTAPPAGPGRPRLVYRVAPGVDGTWHHDGPYERLGLLLLEVLHTGASPRDVGAAEGRRIGATARTDERDPCAVLAERMAEQGFAPRRDPRGGRVDLVMTRCPLAAAAAAAPDVVCDLHRGIADGLAERLRGIAVVDLVAEPPKRAGCRLRLAVAAAASTTAAGG